MIFKLPLLLQWVYASCFQLENRLPLSLLQCSESWKWAEGNHSPLSFLFPEKRLETRGNRKKNCSKERKNSTCSYQKEKGEIKKRHLSSKRKDSYVSDPRQNDWGGGGGSTKLLVLSKNFSFQFEGNSSRKCLHCTWQFSEQVPTITNGIKLVLEILVF